MRELGVKRMSIRGTRMMTLGRTCSAGLIQAARCRRAALTEKKCIIVNGYVAANAATIKAPTMCDTVTLTVRKTKHGVTKSEI